ncbi:hypothetical protein EVAR_94214_1 [Eumeta japonica]|uniref:Uncharacterized protein n=1 Tax=Eumeta variegata TaxID=151549 RepID=A0A4C1UNP4_EUMVA|nr:hypothetical protein EVAR_94214_1 [Eumeta japonica]
MYAWLAFVPRFRWHEHGLNSFVSYVDRSRCDGSTSGPAFDSTPNFVLDLITTKYSKYAAERDPLRTGRGSYKKGVIRRRGDSFVIPQSDGRSDLWMRPDRPMRPHLSSAPTIEVRIQLRRNRSLVKDFLLLALLDDTP